MSDGAERLEASVPVERSRTRFMGELLGEKWLSSFVVCIRERIGVDCVRVTAKDVRMVFTMLGFISEVLRLSFGECGRAFSVLSAWRTERYVLREQKDYAE